MAISRNACLSLVSPGSPKQLGMAFRELQTRPSDQGISIILVQQRIGPDLRDRNVAQPDAHSDPFEELGKVPDSFEPLALDGTNRHTYVTGVHCVQKFR